MTDAFERAGELIAGWYRAALAAADPEAAVRRHLAPERRALLVGGRRVPVAGRLVLVGVGKAAVAMARGAEAVCGGLIADGVIITKDGHATGRLPGRFRVAEASHPVPDERGVGATCDVLALVRDLTAEDVLLALISGGGSALLEAPRPPVTLSDMAATTDLLLRAGAPIQDLNTVRTPLSLVKGGGLRRAAGAATVITLILSDVLGNDPRVIASGPTVPGTPDPAAALAVLDRYRLRGRVPATVLDTLLSMPRGEAGGVEATDDVVTIVADNATAVAAAHAAAAASGLWADIVWRARTGEASEVGRLWVDCCLRTPAGIDVLLGGGEATVTVRGTGVGGRNTEFALAAALALSERRCRDWVVASLATDGQDGPTDAAGAIADVRTVERARAAGVDPVAALAANDSLRVFERAGGVVRPGPTGTNVNDLYFAVRVGALVGGA